MCALEEECLKRKMVRNGLLGYEQGMHKQNYEKKKKELKTFYIERNIRFLDCIK